MSETPYPKIISRLNLILFVCFLLFAVSHLWVALLNINEETKAVSPEESPQVAALYRYYLYPYWTSMVTAVLSAALAAAGAFLSLRLRAATAFRWAAFGLFVLFAAAVGVSFFVSLAGIIFAGVALFFIYALYEVADGAAAARFGEFCRSVSAVTYLGLVRFLVKVLLVFAASGAAVLLVEAALYTTKFGNSYFAYSDFFTYLGFGTAVGAIAGASMSLVALVPAVVFYFAARLARLAKDGRVHVVFAFLLPVWFGLLTGTTFYMIVSKVFWEEIRDLGLHESTTVLAFLSGYLLVMTTCINFRFILKNLPPATKRSKPFATGDYAVYLVISFVAIPLFLLSILRRLWSKSPYIHSGVFFAVALVSAGAILAVFGGMNYPELIEYSYGVSDLYSTMMIGAVICTMFILVRFLGWRSSPRLRLGVPVTVVLLAAAFFAFKHLDKSQQMRLIMYEYAPLGKTMYALVNNPSPELLGRGEEPEDVFEPYGARHGTLPADPGVQDFSAELPPIILIIADAARPDRMNTDGYKRQTTPVLKKFAEDDAVVLTNMRSTSTATHCGMKNLFAGSFSSRCMKDLKTPGKFFTNELLEAGYGRFFISHFHGDINGVSMEAFTRSIPEKERWRFEPIVPYEEKEKTEEALKKIAAYEKEIENKRLEKKGYFVYLHFNATHFPWKHYQDHSKYYPGATYYGESKEDLYDEDMTYVDITIGRFFDGLKEIRRDGKSVYDRAIIIVTADHGTGLNDHGKYVTFLSYEENIRVPFLIKIPGVEPRRVDVPCVGLDVAPTIVNLFRRGVKSRFDGISLLPLITGREKTVDREFLVFFMAFKDSYALIQNNRWKLIYHRDPSRNYYLLYDLKEDSKETRNLSDKMREKCEEMKKVLERFLWEGRGTYDNPRHY